MGRRVAPLRWVCTWHVAIVWAMMYSPRGEAFSLHLGMGGGIGARHLGALRLLHSLRASSGNRGETANLNSVTSGGLGVGEVSTFSGMALEMMRRPVWPVLGKQSVGQVGQVVGGRQSVGRQQVVLGGQVTMGGKAGEASEADVGEGEAQKVPRETQIETYCPDPDCPRGNSLYPMPDDALPPLIHHIKCGQDTDSLVELVRANTDLPKAYIQELLDFGAIYMAVPHAKWQPTVSKVKGMSKAVRVTEDQGVPQDGYVRVHVNPKRHRGAVGRDWSDHVIEKTKDYIVVDKPAGVPTVPTVDNLIESALHQVSVAANDGDDLWVTSRLDVCTSGVVVFGRSSEAAGALNKVIREQQQTKVYRLLCQGEVPTGIMRNRYKKMRGAQKGCKPTLLREFREDSSPDPAHSPWQMAELEVLSCSPVFKEQGSEARLYECEVRLITGRTHQIRLQFAAHGAPLVGDTRYQPVAGLIDEGPDTLWGDGSQLFGKEPERICLQSSKVVFELGEEGTMQFEAGTPWWHQVDKLKEVLCGEWAPTSAY